MYTNMKNQEVVMGSKKVKIFGIQTKFLGKKEVLWYKIWSRRSYRHLKRSWHFDLFINIIIMKNC